MWSVWWQGEPPSPSSTGSPSRCCGDAGGGGSTIGVVVSKGDTPAQPLCLMSSSPNPHLLGPRTTCIPITAGRNPCPAKAVAVGEPASRAECWQRPSSSRERKACGDSGANHRLHQTQGLLLGLVGMSRAQDKPFGVEPRMEVEVGCTEPCRAMW